MIEAVQILISLAIAVWFALWAIAAPICVAVAIIDTVQRIITRLRRR
jgi:hypothetical protein